MWKGCLWVLNLSGAAPLAVSQGPQFFFRTFFSKTGREMLCKLGYFMTRLCGRWSFCVPITESGPGTRKLEVEGEDLAQLM